MGEEASNRRESQIDVIKRLIKTKTNITVEDHEIVACHPIGKNENTTFVIRLGNRSPGSSWHKITEGMKTGDGFNREVNVFINYMLTSRRQTLAKKVRDAKKEKKISKYAIDQNGRIRIKKLGDTDKKYYEVKSENDLNALII